MPLFATLTTSTLTPVKSFILEEISLLISVIIWVFTPLRCSCILFLLFKLSWIDSWKSAFFVKSIVEFKSLLCSAKTLLIVEPDLLTSKVGATLIDRFLIVELGNTTLNKFIFVVNVLSLPSNTPSNSYSTTS